MTSPTNEATPSLRKLAVVDEFAGNSLADRRARREELLSKGESVARQPKTERAYWKLLNRLFEKSQRNRTGVGEALRHVGPMDVATDFIESASETSPSSWNTNRAALLWFFSTNRAETDAYEQAYQLVASTRPPKRSPVRKRRKGAIPEKDLKLLIETLEGMNRSPTGWGHKVKSWLLAGIASGARPSEWVGAKWANVEMTVLSLPNAKRKRAGAVFRLVEGRETVHDVEASDPDRFALGTEFDDSLRTRLVPISKKDQADVQQHMTLLNDYLKEGDPSEVEERYARYFNIARKQLTLACRKTFKDGKRRYSLYNARSQFAANMKAQLPLDEVRQVMGHAPDSRVTMRNYAPRTAAHGRQAPTQAERQAREEARQARARPAKGAEFDRPTSRGG